MKALVTLIALIASVSSASALTSKYTSELEPYASTSKVAKLTEYDVKLALSFISGNRTAAEKRAFIRTLAN
jgi:hypothetical protein